MSELDTANIPVPEKEEGAQKDIVATEETETVEAAIDLFESSKKRLLDVNNWDKIAGKGSAIFTLTDEKGKEAEGSPKVGNYFKIKVPAPKTKVSEEYDWVQVEAINENKDSDKEYLLITVRPSKNPLSKDNDVAHFFSDKSTSSFLILREKKVVTAAVLGRNEIPNTTSSHSWLDKIRNAIVGTGAIAGLSYPQWKGLAKGLLGKD